MYKFFRPLIFNLTKDPETMHNIVSGILRLFSRSDFLLKSENKIFGFEHQNLSQNLLGLKFKNPVGLAAGFDKGEITKALEALGFGFIELGGFTKFPQPGHKRQRIFRLLEDEALINKMGFPNKGADAAAGRLFNLSRVGIPLGINLAKSMSTPLSEATEDYFYSFSRLYNLGDYFAINISSPNTPGLRQLSNKEAFALIIKPLVDFRNKQKIKKPILIKIAVDFSVQTVDEILQVISDYSLDGIISSNTSTARENLKSEDKEKSGGLSGQPLRIKSTQLIKRIHKLMPNLTIMGVGGINSAEAAYEKIKAGASLLQIYTALIYEGPMVVKKINQGLVKLLEKDGLKNISEAVGVEAK